MDVSTVGNDTEQMFAFQMFNSSLEVSGTKTLERSIAVFISVFLSLFFLTATTGNTCFLVIFLKRPSIRSRSNQFVTSLAVSNVLSSILMPPVIFTDTIMETGYINPTLCHILNGFSVFIVHTSCLSTLCISIDRFFAVTKPLTYHAIITKLRIRVMLGCIWSLSALNSLIEGCFEPLRNDWNSCSKNSNISILHQYYVLVNTLVLFVFPFIIHIFIYLRIYQEACSNCARTRFSLSGASHMGESFTAVYVHSTNIHPLGKRRRSIRSSFPFSKNEFHTATLPFCIIMNFFLSWTPYFVEGVLRLFANNVDLIVHHHISMFGILSNSVCSIFLYLFHSETMKSELKHLIVGTKKKLSLLIASKFLENRKSADFLLPRRSIRKIENVREDLMSATNEMLTMDENSDFLLIKMVKK